MLSLPGLRTIVTVHDLRFLHGFAGPLRAAYGRLRFGAALRRAGLVVAVSSAVRDECVARYGLASDAGARRAATAWPPRSRRRR